MKRILALVIVLAVIGAVGWASSAWNHQGPAAQSGSQTVVLIPPHTKLSDIANGLQNAHVLSNALVFQFDLYLHSLNNKLKSGEYAIPSHASMADIAAILVSGKSIQHKLTAAEGLTSDMIYRLVVSDPVLTGDAGPVPAEGTLLPETYLFTRGVTRAQMLERMHKAQEKFLAEHWPTRAAGLPFQTQEQAVILASIVEKETALPEERRHIAAVFVNRLKAGIKLQSDPTIIYGISKGYPLGRGIRASEILAATPYNTYVIAGLPPAPICDPGKDSLDAVLNPEQSGDLYFVASGTGGHVFAATMAEHAKNVIAYRAMEKLKEALPQPIPVAAPPAVSRRRHHHA